ncbi:hypothetical protein HPB49_018043 [Dermacentor silvarum]|uniref:Uncharacterized protein n=1 Tax=Dermacentor silvarum TaxID=543639 RepID=A0ACB8CZ17_DERSI|nr:hypothetical protein HPB49_018043 [Dermacentor silvarum]
MDCITSITVLSKVSRYWSTPRSRPTPETCASETRPGPLPQPPLLPGTPFRRCRRSPNAAPRTDSTASRPLAACAVSCGSSSWWSPWAGSSTTFSFLTSNYFSYPIMTATEEVHAEELHFPAITVCNLNLLRKSSFDDYLKDIAARAGNPSSATTTTAVPEGGGGVAGARTAHGKTRDMFSPTTKGYSSSGNGGNGVDDEEDEVCYKTVDEFLKSSRTMDLSDMWMNFIATKEQLQKFGHQANDLVVQCTYNARNCFDER